MKMLLRATSLMLGLAIAGTALARDDFRGDFEIDRMPNFNGVTGLFQTASAFTLKAGEVRLHASNLLYSDNNTALADEEGTLTLTPISLTIGLTNNWEIAFLSRLVSLDYEANSLLDPNRPIGTSDFKDGGLGDSEVTTKIQVMTESEYTPHVAIGLTGILSTGDEDKGLGRLEDYGIRGFLAMSMERPIFSSAFIGIYFEVQGVGIDPSDDDSDFHDNYSVVNVGLRFPFSDNNKLHIIGEITQVDGKKDPDPVALGAPTIYNAGDYSGVTVGLRYAWRYISLSGGYQTREFEFDDPLLTLDDASLYFVSFGLGF